MEVNRFTRNKALEGNLNEEQRVFLPKGNKTCSSYSNCGKGGAAIALCDSGRKFGPEKGQVGQTPSKGIFSSSSRWTALEWALSTTWFGEGRFPLIWIRIESPSPCLDLSSEVSRPRDPPGGRSHLFCSRAFPSSCQRSNPNRHLYDLLRFLALPVIRV